MSDEYLISSIYYIHSNPAHHHLINDFRNYKWSSYQDIINKRNKFVSVSKVLSSAEEFKNSGNMVGRTSCYHLFRAARDFQMLTTMSPAGCIPLKILPLREIKNRKPSPARFARRVDFLKESPLRVPGS